MRNTDTVTIYHAEIHPTSGEKSFSATVYTNCVLRTETSLERQREKNGSWLSRRTVIRIPTEEKIPIALGDIVVPGVSASQNPPTNGLLVSGFWDNRRGSPFVRHFRIECE